MLRNSLWLATTLAVVGLLIGYQVSLPAQEGKPDGDRNPACQTSDRPSGTPALPGCEDHGTGTGTGGKPGERK